MLEEYKELCRRSADLIPDWKDQSKNDLCRAYVANKGNPVLQNSYFSAVMYKYWNLISKYYYMSCNCATIEECYGWLVDSVMCCLSLASWEDPSSSIYKDPNGPDKVINRCMKCARLTYYQFINRKKRRDNFGLLSIDELKELFGNNMPEPEDYEQEFDVSEIMIKEYIIEKFNKKDYFVAFLLDNIISSNVFDAVLDKELGGCFELNLRRLVKLMNTLDDSYLTIFAKNYNLPIADVIKGCQYIKGVPEGGMRKKVVQTLESLRHSNLVLMLKGGDSCAN